jgi:hypothetical protein
VHKQRGRTSLPSYFRFEKLTGTMASSFANALRLAEPGLCRRCASLPSRRTFVSIASQTPKRETRSRPAPATFTLRLQSSARPTTQNARSFSSSPKRTYKSVQEAKARYKLGVRPTTLSPTLHPTPTNLLFGQ